MSDHGLCKSADTIRNNKGFSLVELIICVAILAVATVPLYQSMTLSTRTNAKAQSKQNATSLAESVMEEIKASSIEEMKTKYNGTETDAEGKVIPKTFNLGLTDTGFFGASGAETTATTRASTAKSKAGSSDRLLTGDPGALKQPFYVLYKHDAVSTQGEKFDVIATLRSSTYMGAENANASDANSKKIPKIEEIDSLNQAVITTKEFSKYDKAALDYFQQNGASIDAGKKIVSKEITIEKKDSPGAIYDQVSVDCRVIYRDNSTPVHTYQRDIFSGTFGQPTDVEGGTTKVLPLASNIYLFYKKNADIANETITVIDSATKGTHKVYLINQNVGSTLTINGTTVTIKESESGTPVIRFYQNSQLDENGNINDASGKHELITNMTASGSATEGHIYNEEASIRIYDVNVSLVKDGVEYASLHSTKEANDKNE